MLLGGARGGGGWWGLKVVVVHFAGAPFITVAWGRKVGVSLITHTHAHAVVSVEINGICGLM